MRKIIFHKELLDYIKKKKGRALDIGCGESNYSQILSRNGWQVDLIDKKEKFIKLKKFHNQRIFIIDLENPENRFLLQRIFFKKYDLILFIKYTNREMLKKINITLNKKGLIFIENFMRVDSKNDRKYKLKKFELTRSNYKTLKFFQGVYSKKSLQAAILRK